jgi:dynein intermediate chain
MLGVGHEAYEITPPTPTRDQSINTTSIATQTDLAAGDDSATGHETYTAPRPKTEVVSYSVGIQTSEPWPPAREDGEDAEIEGSDLEQASPSKRASKRLSRRERDREEELRRNIRREIEEELEAINDPAATGTQADGALERFPARALTADEMDAVTSSAEFLDFVDRSSKVIERALDEEYDVLADYALDGMDGLDDDEDEGYASSRGRKGRRMKETVQFFDERWNKKRMISDISFSPKVGTSFRTRESMFD